VLRRPGCGFPKPEVEASVKADFVETSHIGEIVVAVREVR
jgi:hypothetical protein